MAVDIATLQKRTQEILSLTKDLKDLSDITSAQFQKNKERQYAVMHALQLAIEACLSVGNHIVAQERLGIPRSYQDTFSLLEKGGILPSDFAEEMKKMARFRNRLVHIYWDIDLEQLYTVIAERLGDFEEFVKYIRKHYPV
ncbi:MAG: DUF86 domain-containing protein [bacterium]